MSLSRKFHTAGLLTAGLALGLLSCKKDKSGATGWNYNDPKNGGFEKVPYVEQETGPGLVLIEGGTFTMGRVEQDVNYEWDHVPRRVTVSSFYMDETEVTNIFYREYLYWLERVFGEDYPEVVKKAKPDTLVWRSKLGYNEPYVEYYLRHPAYNDYPVVGVNWVQATDYCAWRSDRVNEQILIRENILENNPTQIAEDNFNTDSYLENQYDGVTTKKQLKDLRTGSDRKVRMEDGILLPKYRLPTEAEWEYAALALVGNTDPSTDREIVRERRLYPWNGHIARNPQDKFKGDFIANFRRGRGDYMGSAGRLNDNADITAPAFSYWPNDFGLYNMAGNLSEWVMDNYRPFSLQDMDEFRPFRGNVFKKKLLNDEGGVADKDSLGRIQNVDVEEKENVDRRNYKKADYIDYRDGDYNSSIYYNDESFKEDPEKQNELMYEFGNVTLINKNARVVKGGSWKDPAYWMVPGTRRFMDENTATNWIGFRCAMDRVGSPVGLGKKNQRRGTGGSQYRK